MLEKEGFRALCWKKTIMGWLEVEEIADGMVVVDWWL